MDEADASHSGPSGSERPTKRQRLASDQDEETSDYEDSHPITRSMKAEMREELADLENPGVTGGVHTDAEEEGDVEIYGEGDESDDDGREEGASEAENQEATVHMVVDGEERVVRELRGRVRIASGPPSRFLRTRTAAEIMQAMEASREFGGETTGDQSNLSNAAEQNPVTSDQPKQAHTEQVAAATKTDQTKSAAEGVAANGNSVKKGSKEKKKKRAFFDPRLWPEGRQEIGFLRKAHQLAKKGVLKCCETGVQLDSSQDKSGGTLWEILRSQDKVDWREIDVQQDSREFLKACMRLGRMIEPERLARLLGEKRRGEDYCRFVLAAFVGLLNINKTRQLLRGEGVLVVEDRHGDVVVNADGMYSSDDELLKSMDVQDNKDEEPVSEAVEPIQETAVTNVQDEAPRSDDNDDIWAGKQFLYEVLAMSKQDDEKFASSLSYVLRTYLSEIACGPISNFAQFVDKGSKLSMKFEEATRQVCGGSTQWPICSKTSEINRLKWLTDSMPAPEMGPGRSFQLGTANLWCHASENFSAQLLARMSLINHDRLLDWLTYVALEGKVPLSDQEYNRERNIVVSIAPIPLLYLADKAASFAMKVLGVAARTVMQDPMEWNGTEFPKSITTEDIRDAAGVVLGMKEENRVAFDVFADLASESMVLAQGSWPHLLQRPMTASRYIALCDRAPECGFGVPLNAVHEAKAVLDSLKQPVRRFFYAKEGIFKMRDPSHFMSRSEQDEIRAERDAWRKRNAVAKYSKSEALSRLRDNSKKGKPSKQKAKPPIEVIDLDGDEVMIDAGVTTENDQVSVLKSPEVAETSHDVQCHKDISGVGEVAGKGDENVVEVEETGPKNCELQDERTQAERISQLLGVRVDIDDEFLSHNNAAELILEQHGGRDEMSKRVKTLNVQPSKDLGEKLKDAADQGLKQLLNESKNVKAGLPTSISYHRMAWICMRALGEDVNAEDVDGKHLLGYSGTANFTNFGVLGSEKTVKLSPNGLDGLIQLVDQVVRREAETLMACASHDDGRPWIDRADVILVQSIRKEKYVYGDISFT